MTEREEEREREKGRVTEGACVLVTRRRFLEKHSWKTKEPTGIQRKN